MSANDMSDTPWKMERCDFCTTALPCKTVLFHWRRWTRIGFQSRPTRHPTLFCGRRCRDSYNKQIAKEGNLRVRKARREKMRADMFHIRVQGPRSYLLISQRRLDQWDATPYTATHDRSEM